jgi:large conductance mechanosensitive channel
LRKFLSEFKEFALRGNVIDLAIGVIIGGAFQGVVKSLTDDIISPLIGLFARTNFNDMVLNVFGVDIRYGSFITSSINFIIMALVIFLLVKSMNRLSALGQKIAPKEEKSPSTKICIYCLSEISINATRCPNCTSELEVEKDKENDKDKNKEEKSE